MDNKVKYILSAIVLIFVIGLVYVLVTGSEASASGAQVKVDKKSFDFGIISMADGLTTHDFEIKNEGTDDLILTGVKTSCMCTSAIINDGEKDSPKFGMHNNPISWSLNVAPGKTVTLKVIYDPNAHGPNATGTIARDVTVMTNDPDSKDQKLTFKIYGDVVK